LPGAARSVSRSVLDLGGAARNIDEGGRSTMKVEVTTENFEQEVLQSDVPVLIDFWAEWCMPCKMIAPVLDEMAEEYDGKLKIGKLNVDEQGELAARYNVVSIPTLMVFKGGEIAGQQIGAAPRERLEELVKPHMD
jgi:thioredoxin 1